MVITSAERLPSTASMMRSKTRVRNRAHQLANLSGVEARLAVDNRRAGDGLVHDAERVAHGAVAGFGEQGERGFVGVDAFVLGDAAQLA